MLATSTARERWVDLITTRYHDLVRAEATGRLTLLDKYGATSPAEFFAVATECFFEKPTQLARRHPELYELFQAYYQQDPARVLRETAD